MVYLLSTFQILYLQLLAAPRTIIFAIFYNIYPVNARTFLYYNSFLTSAVRNWNNIPDEHRNVDSVIAFKNVLSRDKPVVPKRYLLEIGKKKSFTHA